MTAKQPNWAVCTDHGRQRRWCGRRSPTHGSGSSLLGLSSDPWLLYCAFCNSMLAQTQSQTRSLPPAGHALVFPRLDVRPRISLGIQSIDRYEQVQFRLCGPHAWAGARSIVEQSKWTAARLLVPPPRLASLLFPAPRL